MFSKELEALIDAALADGILTTKEKQVLYKKAQALGIDLDEFEMVLNARLTKVEKEERKVAEAKAPKKEYHGTIRKCPNCQATIGALDTVCPECGYEFSNLEANELVKQFTDKLTKLRADFDKKILRLERELDLLEVPAVERSKIETIANTIQTFPLPTSRNDLFEFIVAMQAGMLNPSIYKGEGDAYRVKYIEALTKAKVLFPKDPVLSLLISDEKKVLRENIRIRRKQKNTRTMLGVLLNMQFL